jgi:hypothetical protein
VNEQEGNHLGLHALGKAQYYCFAHAVRLADLVLVVGLQHELHCFLHHELHCFQNLERP